MSENAKKWPSSRCACLFNSREYFPLCRSHFFIGFSKGDVSRSVSTDCLWQYLLFLPVLSSLSAFQGHFSYSVCVEKFAKKQIRLFETERQEVHVHTHFQAILWIVVTSFFLYFFFIAIYVHDTFLSKFSTEFQTWDSELQNSDLAPEPPSCVLKPHTPLLQYLTHLRILNCYRTIFWGNFTNMWDRVVFTDWRKKFAFPFLSFCFTMRCVWFRKLAPLLNQLQTVATPSHRFSSALRRLVKFASSFDWFAKFSATFLYDETY